ncbi:hypothetical protein BW723_04640 [Polaribacter reichenbachii]|uniref:DUF4270 domain-containing protein n=1 Tax=Polaribacter reichenbachii TaxID=996801 RepID=A0A1B8TWM9_9FLAO|nr:DUF4270 domain-containing protein [Polaribacter reichenbachii]APZ48056.1 hypothetical protein BW723_04640 [Polaribacter reichenbachii]AUC20530.1 hypothetical protein BTO17_12645 [Polaribacter reichenbachii]OBY63992.1 hypothetical protein LPB301_11070 [Polaribacter reichenbachii]
MIKIIRRSVIVSILVCLSVAIVSCEEDFTNINSNVLTNTKFNTNAVTVDIVAENSSLERIQSDNISRQLGQYLLGVYNSTDYEKLEASIVSQLTITTGVQVVDDANIYGADTTVVTKIDTVFLKLPYQVVLDSDDLTYDLDSIIGDQSEAFTFNVYQSNTYLNLYNPLDPTKINSFYSNDVFEKSGTALNSELNYQFKPNYETVDGELVPVDTMLVIKRRLFNDNVATQDTVKIYSSTASTLPVPFARIPLDEDRIKELFLDKYESSEFETQEAFNDYFRGLILEATGVEGSLISFDFNATTANLIPSLEIYYTNTVLKSGSTILDTISKNNSYPLTGFRVNTFKMEDKVYPANEEIKIQGTAGSEAKITIIDQAKIDELRQNNWLINDASLSFYINQSADTLNVPERLYLYKTDEDATNPSFSQIKDATSESSFGGIQGELQRDASGKVEKYTFRITDYMSDILSGDIDYNPNLRLKVYNPTDLPTTTTDTIFNNFSWNPKAVTLFNNTAVDDGKKAVLKISYTEKQ